MLTGMKKIATIFIIACLIHFNNLIAQDYENIIKEDTSIWYVAHKQLAGFLMDTIFAKDYTNGWTNIYGQGAYFSNEPTFTGKVHTSPDNDKIWYIPPNETDSILIFDLSLEKNDTFLFNGYPGMVDTIYIKDGRKYIEFNLNTDWGENIMFIEGVGPNVSFIYFWIYSGILTPYVVCKFDNEIRLYSADNPFYIEDCSLKLSSISSSKIKKLQLYPNPFLDYVQIQENSINEKYHVKIFDIYGALCAESGVNDKRINTAHLVKGIYFFQFVSENEKILNFKMIKK